MYNSHFGFHEKPFKLVPNPDFLFLSKIHEIALAHLTYAVSQGDGFVVITGEVGTGKTTLCRIFLERLDENIESAYIFNPKLDSVQLLTTICNEFGIQTNLSTLKQLLDVINGYLIMKNKQEKKVLLLIDEAQNLSIENLEMVRMLSNLETTRNKLLQIILVGQPELGDKLDSYELRQLAQRISLSAHLTPLGAEETAGYIQHRVNIAAQRQAYVFTKGASRQIYQYSRGIPRVINIASDRALLCAYSLNKPVVNSAIAKIAVQELSQRGHKKRRPAVKKAAIWATAIIVALVLSGGVYSKIWRNESTQIQDSASSNTNRNNEQSTLKSIFSGNDDAPVKTYKINNKPVNSPMAPAATTSQFSEAAGSSVQVTMATTKNALKSALNSLEHQTSRFAAVARTLERWHQPSPNAAQFPVMVDDFEYFDIAAHQYGLRMHIIKSDLVLVKSLNLPAIISIKTDMPGDVVYVAMIGWKNGLIELATQSNQIIHTNLESLLPHMYGPIYVYWKNVLNVEGIIASGAPVRAVRAVKKLLLKAGYDQLEMTPVYDIETRQAIIDFQVKHNLQPDGLVGPLTKIFLIKETHTAIFPLLDSNLGRRHA